MEIRKQIRLKTALCLFVCSTLLYTIWNLSVAIKDINEEDSSQENANSNFQRSINQIKETKKEDGDSNFEDGWTAWGQKQDLRKLILMSTCSDFRLNQRNLLQRLLLSPETHFKHLMVDDHNEVLYCYIPEVAHDIWKPLWITLTGNNNNGRNLSGTRLSPETYDSRQNKLVADEKIRSSISLKLQTYTKVIVVQHPFHRLLSNYMKIVHRKSDQSSSKNLESGEILIKNEFRTLPEFVDYLTKGSNIMANSLWKPYEVLCHPCAMEYDIIIKAETLADDTERFLRRIRAPEHIHYSNFSRTLGKHDDVSWKDYQKMLTSKQIEGLHKAYDRDLKLFGYG